ncbi:hypothetical protein EJP77_02655 [Paenibacillus zeisoli]|uniref:VCBS repeat-containing protein n=1 Tax=Paenibacillus zeisoli TaxID=2496267 RepID=A0A3S1DDK7_9BACL|nr:hypothetical protein [Paenibacillus zeisoli]RUT35919.1 hypothetical protein EJP77_02655 [Paenibacillus zeisoli]
MKRVIRLARARWLNITAGCLCLAVLSGCDLITDPKLLMKPPQSTSSLQSLRSVIDANIPPDTRLQPRGLNGIQSIQTEDLDNNGNKDAVVFFESTKGDANAQGMVLEETEDTWVIKQKFEGDGRSLVSLEYRDLNHDGRKVILAGFSKEDLDERRILAVYAFTGQKVDKILLAPYSNYVVEDLNDDDLLEVTTVDFKKNDYNLVTCYQIREDQAIKLDSLQLGAGLNDYLNVMSGKVTPNQNGIVLDASYLTHSAYSTLIMMKDNKLVNVLDQDDNLNDLPIRSGDVNDDDILEMGRLKIPSGWEKVILDKPPRFLDYYQWEEKVTSGDLKDMKFIKEQYMDPDGRFVFDFPDNLKGKVTLDQNSVVDQYLRFVKIDNHELVAEIKFVPLSQWEKLKPEWSLLMRDNDQVIVYKTSFNTEIMKKNLR